MPDFAAAVETVVRRCLAVREGEEVLVIADTETRDIGQSLRDAAQRAGGDAVLALMTPRATSGTEPPATIAEALAACDVFIAPTSRSLSHTTARKRANDNGARGATLPGVTGDMLARLMGIDFDALGARCRAVAELLTAADDAHISCPRGTDLHLDLRGRSGISDDGLLTDRGAFGNLPCGEGFISPAGGHGRVVAMSLAGVGLVRQNPAVLTIEDGQITQATELEGETLLDRLRAAGSGGTNLAELGVGTNDAARLTGNVLEDEKILGTVHVAFGASAGIGGNVSVPIHLDVVVVDASLSVGGTVVLERGQFVLTSA